MLGSDLKSTSMYSAIDVEVAIRSAPWAMTADRLNTLAAAMRRGHTASRGPRQAMTRTGSVAVIPAHGVLTEHSGWLSVMGLGVSTDCIGQQLKLALLDDSVRAIVLDIASQGGEVYGIAGLAAELLAARRRKPIAAIANSQAESAAYWLAACCTEVYSTPGGQVGGIGIATRHQDESAALEKAGISIELISAGKYKTEGNPFGPLSAGARAHMQSQVDDYYGMFTSDVARGRNTTAAAVRAGFGQGRVFGAEQAKAAKMVDGICTLDQLVSDLARGKSSGGGAGASARLLFNIALAGSA